MIHSTGLNGLQGLDWRLSQQASGWYVGLGGPGQRQKTHLSRCFGRHGGSVRFGAGQRNQAPHQTATGNGAGDSARGPTRCTATGPRRYFRGPAFFCGAPLYIRCPSGELTGLETGPWTGHGAGRKKIDSPPRPGVRGGEFVAGPACPGANTTRGTYPAFPRLRSSRR